MQDSWITSWINTLIPFFVQNLLHYVVSHLKHINFSLKIKNYIFLSHCYVKLLQKCVAPLSVHKYSLCLDGFHKVQRFSSYLHSRIVRNSGLPPYQLIKNAKNDITRHPRHSVFSCAVITCLNIRTFIMACDDCTPGISFLFGPPVTQYIQTIVNDHF